MTQPPAHLCVYHITHVQNLPSILQRGRLISHATLLQQGGPAQGIGMSRIKQRRLTVPVDGHPGLLVGDCVPFYFCPRSIMLYVIHCANHAELAYRGGQAPIVHLVADLRSVVAWADQQARRWAFSLSNAGAVYAEFRTSLTDLPDIDWEAVAARDWRSATIKEAKQAEFLLEGDLPWSLVREIGVQSQGVANQVNQALANTSHRPDVTIQPLWYY